MPYVIEALCLGSDQYTAISKACQFLNSQQNEFHFAIPPPRLRDTGMPFKRGEYHVAEVLDFLRKYRDDAKGHRPYLVGVIAEPLSSATLRNLFGSHEASEGLAVVTTNDHGRYVPTPEIFLGYYLLRYALSFVAPAVRAHADTRGCFFDKKEHKPDLLQSLYAGDLCDTCMEAFQERFSPEVFDAVHTMINSLRAQLGVSGPEPSSRSVVAKALSEDEGSVLAIFDLYRSTPGSGPLRLVHFFTKCDEVGLKHPHVEQALVSLTNRGLLTVTGRAAQREWLLVARPRSIEPSDVSVRTSRLITSAHSEPKNSDSKPRLVILVHGIRTRAEWQGRIRHLMEADGQTTVETPGYGYFDVVRFLCPVFTRRGPIEEVHRKINDALDLHRKADEVVLVGHSFGTHIIGTILRKDPRLRVNRILLCGSILSRTYRWDQLPNRPTAVLNEASSRDIWPILAKSVTWGYGSTGTFGFQTPGVHDRYHNLKHSDYFKPGFAEMYWVPWIQEGTVKPTQYETARRPPTPFLKNLIEIVPLKWVILALLLVAICITFRWTRSATSSKHSTENETIALPVLQSSSHAPAPTAKQPPFLRDIISPDARPLGKCSAEENHSAVQPFENGWLCGRLSDDRFFAVIEKKDNTLEWMEQKSQWHGQTIDCPEVDDSGLLRYGFRWWYCSAADAQQVRDALGRPLFREIATWVQYQEWSDGVLMVGIPARQWRGGDRFDWLVSAHLKGASLNDGVGQSKGKGKLRYDSWASAPARSNVACSALWYEATSGGLNPHLLANQKSCLTVFEQSEYIKPREACTLFDPSNP